MSHLQSLDQIPMDPIFEVGKRFAADPHPKKVNLGIGIYTSREGKPVVFPSIAKSARSIQTENFGYKPMQGDLDFLKNTAQLFLGKNLYQKYSEKIALQQSCGGTQACRLMADIFQKNFNNISPLVGETKRGNENQPKLLIGAPTWENHLAIFQHYDTEIFSHLDVDNNIDFDAHKKAFQENPNSIAILHGGPTHNPTGLNLSKTQLSDLIDLANKQNIFIFLDFAYLGFGNGLDEDRAYLQEIFEKADNLAIAISFSKNACLYRHRLGALMIKTKDEEQKNILESQLQQLIREDISNLPLFPAELMNIVFDKYQDQWLSELETVRADIQDRREQLIKILIEKNPEKFGYLADCRGMFALLGLDKSQVDRLASEFAIYLPPNGRINFAGIITEKIPYIAEGLLAVV